jgi:predicted DNA-binding WGR domain protein
MTAFHDFLRARLATGGFSTEDALTSFLPLARQVVQAHAADKVAPLDGVAALQVEGVRIWFHESTTRSPSHNAATVQALDKPLAGVEVLSEHKRTLDVDAGPGKVANLSIGTREQELTRPVYLPGYLCWEQQLGHHDPLSDVHCLGLLLASLSCGLDLNEPQDLEAFVAHRKNLFKLTPGLHPVLAKAIVKMTELSRHGRPQDLATVIHNLEHYRDQNVDFDFDLASAEASAGAGAGRELILGKLQERLFEISRRNRLLHFRGTLHSVNLTYASVPLSFDVQHIRPDQVLTWTGDFAKMVSAGEPVSLNRYLNFAEQLYLPSVLDRVRSEAIRDAAEFGFEQLRLAICFLRWANLKESPAEHYDSPLVLLPVRLVKKKGVRDSYWLQPLTSEAEINPVVRHLFKQLHGIDLPATIDLAETTLDAFYEDLAARIGASESGVTLRKVDRPRIELIHDQAQRRLDRFRRSARLSGRGIRSFLDLDYSYDAGNFHPLGLAIFRAKVRPGPTRLREIVQDKPAPRSYMTAPSPADSPVSAKEKQFYSLREEADDNPYNWDFDLCRLTLGNFKYRKMTLVRDYTELRQDGIKTPAFDAVFSLAARPVAWEAPPSPPLEGRFHIVACDPTQAAAIGLSQTGASYIIQGPPGTGKSQTITNLIADYVVRGKRVLFVCEKRAAIDVVFARLRQQGLHQLCCLIHDSQADKKEFIQDLKATYEGLLGEQRSEPRAWRTRRSNLLKALQQELEPLEEYNRSMLSTSSIAAVPARVALERAVELSSDMPALSAAVKEGLPDYAQWVSHREQVESLAMAVADVQPDGVLSHHPLRLLKPALVQQERPAQLVGASLRRAQEQLPALERALRASGVPEGHWRTLREAGLLFDYAASVHGLARRGLLGLLDERSERSLAFAKAAKELGAARQRLTKAAEATTHWSEKLPADDVASALEQAKELEGKPLSVFKPSWWRLRGVLRRCYRFEAHAVWPRWSHILTALANEHAAAAHVADVDRAGRDSLSVDEPLEAIDELLQQSRRATRQLSPALGLLHEELLGSTRAAEVVGALVEMRAMAQELQATLSTFLVEFEGLSLGELREALRGVEASLDSLGSYLYCLGQLARLPAPLATAFRTLPLSARQLEAALVGRCVEELLRADRALHRFNGAVRDGHVQRMAKLSRRWQEANAGAVLEKARENFLEHVRISSLPAAQLTAEQKELKAAYNRGRRDLEHEFGKVMRHKSIRDLVTTEPGAVVFDLKPVWLMSPLSVSDTLPLRSDAFDVVIFDEASQITLESAVPSIFRAPQTIVVGDEMQLPPTDFFSAKSDGQEEEGLLLSEDGQVFEYDLSSDSLLNHAAKNLPSRMLGWHYRSRSESLISFSNWAFYQGKLLTVPEERLGSTAREEIVARSPADGSANVERVLDRPLSFHFIDKGIYDNRRNRAEAEYIAQLVRGLIASEKRHSIGIVAFSEAQQTEIERALSALASEDKQFGELLETEYEREVDGQYVGLLVKNLENIQGDERDVVILSVCYGPAPDGKMRMNFGPINQGGGERRLNVAFSRAKHHMCVVSSIHHADITNEYNDGANCLRNYLRYSATCSAGDAAGSQRVLREVAVWRDVEQPQEVRHGPVVTQLAAELRQRGYAVDLGVGMSHFRCDLAARRHGELRYRLGILVDTEEHYLQKDLLERELMRPELLRGFGWQILHVLSADWVRERKAVVDRLVAAIEGVAQPPLAEAQDEESDDDSWDEFDGPAEAEPGPFATEPPPPAAELPPEAMPGPAGTPAGTGKRYFEFVGGASRKFWEIDRAGHTVTVRFGRIGTSGQTQQKICADEATAVATAQRLVREKVGKGYVEQRA